MAVRKGGLLKPNPKNRAEFDLVSETGARDESNILIDDVLKDEDVMEWLKCSKQWLADHRTRVEPIIPHYPLGKKIRYSRKAIQKWLDDLCENRPTWKRTAA